MTDYSKHALPAWGISGLAQNLSKSRQKGRPDFSGGGYRDTSSHRAHDATMTLDSLVGSHSVSYDSVPGVEVGSMLDPTYVPPGYESSEHTQAHTAQSSVRGGLDCAGLRYAIGLAEASGGLSHEGRVQHELKDIHAMISQEKLLLKLLEKERSSVPSPQHTHRSAPPPHTSHTHARKHTSPLPETQTLRQTLRYSKAPEANIQPTYSKTRTNELATSRVSPAALHQSEREQVRSCALVRTCVCV